MKITWSLALLAGALIPLGCKPPADTVVKQEAPPKNDVVVVQPQTTGDANAPASSGAAAAPAAPAKPASPAKPAAPANPAAPAKPASPAKSASAAKSKDVSLAFHEPTKATVKLHKSSSMSDSTELPAAKTSSGKNSSSPKASSTSESSQTMHKTASGLQYEDTVVGTGPSPKPGQKVTVDYTGWLMDGTKFDSSKDHGDTFSFPLGQGRVIPGWDEGVASMKVGGTRILVVPPDLGYGAQGTPGGPIPPNATLKFEVELHSID